MSYRPVAVAAVISVSAHLGVLGLFPGSGLERVSPGARADGDHRITATLVPVSDPQPLEATQGEQAPLSSPVSPGLTAGQAPGPVEPGAVAQSGARGHESPVDAGPAQTLTGDAFAVDAAAVILPMLDAHAESNAPPTYPLLSRRFREQGTVVLTIRIEADGTVSQASVLHSSGYRRLDQSALEAVRGYQYRPATRGGEAVPWDYTLPMEFRLQ